VLFGKYLINYSSVGRTYIIGLTLPYCRHDRRDIGMPALTRYLVVIMKEN